MQGRERLVLLFKLKLYVNMWAFGVGVVFSKVCVVDFLMLLRSGGKLCGWLERALWEYCISKDDFEENRCLSFSLLTFFALCACLSVSRLLLFSFICMLQRLCLCSS